MFKKGSLYLEVGDRCITKSEYIPENMDKVTTLLVGGDNKKGTYEERIDINDIVEFNAKVNTNDSALGLVKLLGFNMAFKLEIVTKNKTYLFSIVGDICDLNKLLALSEENIESAYELSCIYRLSKRFY